MRISLTLGALHRPPRGDEPCQRTCVTPWTTCALPKLTEGTYAVEIAGESRFNAGPRLLVVSAAASTSGCTLRPVQASSVPIDVSGYSRRCETDDDCSLVAAAAPCNPCTCADTAIATSEKDRFDATHREASSQCPAPQDYFACQSCPAKRARCDFPPNAPFGSCIASDD